MLPDWPTPLLTSLIGGCLPALQLGFHIGVLNAPQAYVQNDLDITSDEFGVAVSIFSLGGLAGAAFVGKLADIVGRKGFFVLSAIPFFVGGLFTFLVNDFAALVMQRILLGVICGASTVVVPVFLKEIAPRDMVGTFGAMNQMSIVTGILFAQCLGFCLDAVDDWWRISVSITSVIAAIEWALSPQMAESPFWLVTQGRPGAAKVQLSRLRGTKDVDEEMAGIIAEVQGDEESAPVLSAPVQPSATGSLNAPAKGAATGSRKESMAQVLAAIMRDEAKRRALFCSIVLQLGQQLSGVNLVFWFSNSLFESMGITPPLLGTVLAGGVNVASTATALAMVDVYPRRWLLKVGSLTMCCAAFLLTMGFHVGQTSLFGMMLALVGVVLFVTGFELGLGPVPWLMAAELFEGPDRSTALTASLTVNWLANFTTGLIFVPLMGYLGANVFLPFAAILGVFVAFVEVYLPETKDRALEDVHAELVGHPHA